MIGGGPVDDSVSVVIPMFNGGPWIGEALASVAGQSHPVSECVVVDDGSTDDGPTVVEEFAASSSLPVHLLRISHVGVSGARNAGIRATVGDYVAFLDSDDVWAPQKIERQVEAMRRSAAVICTTGYAQFDSDTRTVQGVVVGRRPDRTIRRWLALEGNGLLLSSTGLVRRSALEEVNEFDSRISICEDLDLAIRLREIGPILIDREVLVGYRQHATQAHRRMHDVATNMAKLYRLQTLERYKRSFRRRCLANLDAHVGYSLLAKGEIGEGMSRLTMALRRDPLRLVTLPVHAVARRISRQWRAVIRRSTWPVAVEQA